MFLALFMKPSPQFEAFELPNQELLEPEGNHDEEPELIEGSQLDDELDGNQLEEELEGYQLDDEEDQLDCEENREDPSTTPTPKPIPKTARTVEIG
jgi:hypothetical protein